MTTFTMQDLTPEQQVAINKHEEAHAMNSNINELPVTKEEEEAMDALSRLGAGVPLIPEPTTQQTLANMAIPQPEVCAELLHKPTLETIIANISTQLQLLATVIKENAEKGNSHADQSLQECVSATLEQAEWFKDMVEERIDEQVDDKDMSYEIESAVEDHFNNNFSLDDHVDITAEVESKVEDIAEDLLRDIVEERLAEIVSNKLQNLRITFD